MIKDPRTDATMDPAVFPDLRSESENLPIAHLHSPRLPLSPWALAGKTCWRSKAANFKLSSPRPGPRLGPLSATRGGHRSPNESPLIIPLSTKSGPNTASWSPPLAHLVMLCFPDIFEGVPLAPPLGP